MISFDADSRQFNLRAAAIVLNGSQVLSHRLEGDAFWSFPGGRVEGKTRVFGCGSRDGGGTRRLRGDC